MSWKAAGKVRQASPSCPEAAAAAVLAWNPAHSPPTQKYPSGAQQLQVRSNRNMSPSKPEKARKRASSYTETAAAAVAGTLPTDPLHGG